MVNIWVDSFNNSLEPESCLLSQTDSTSASGWLRKSNFADRDDEHIQLSAARKLAELLIETESCLYSQWFPGDMNSISDSLSRDFHIPSSNLAFLLQSHYPDQAPFGLTILPLPPDIVSWLTCQLLSQPQKEPWSKEQTISNFARGIASKTTYPQLGSTMTHTSMNSPKTTKLRSSAPSPSQLEKADLVLKAIINPSSLNQSEPPWTAWLRPSSWLTEQTQGWTENINLRNYEDTPQLTTLHNHNQQ
jgi:hypothetical protein